MTNSQPSAGSRARDRASRGIRALLLPMSSLRGRLLYTLLGLLAVLLVVEAWEHLQRARSRAELIEAAQAAQARSTASGVQSAVEDLFSTSKILGDAVIANQVPNVAASAFLEHGLRAQPGVVAVEVWNRDGALVAAAPSRQAITPPPVPPPAPTYVGLQLPERFRISAPFDDPPTAAPRVRLTRLLLSADLQPWGEISMVVDAASLSRLLGDSGPSVELLLDRSGRVLAMGPRARGSLPATPDIRRALAVRDAQGLVLAAPDGRRLSGARASVVGTPWVVMALAPRATMLHSIDEETRRSLLLLVGIILALAVTTAAVLQLVLRPLVRLSAAARQLGHGELSFRLREAEYSELDAVVSAFNSMAERLEETHQALLDANQRLENEKLGLDALVRERTEALRLEHEKVLRAERLSTLGLFSSSIAHDLRNPLNVIHLSLEAIRLRLKGNEDARVGTRLAAAEREVRRAEGIIRTLLGFARTGQPVLEPVDLAGLARDVVGVVDAPAHVSMLVDCSPDLPVLAADRAQLFQLLENLVRNAVQAVGEAEGAVRLAVAASRGEVFLRVQDTGPGIEPERLESIFEPLVTSRTTGTGLGLALARRVAEAHGGSIVARNPPGGGALFEVTLPLKGPVPTPEAAADPQSAAPAPPSRALLE